MPAQEGVQGATKTRCLASSPAVHAASSRRQRRYRKELEFDRHVVGQVGACRYERRTLALVQCFRVVGRAPVEPAGTLLRCVQVFGCVAHDSGAAGSREQPRVLDPQVSPATRSAGRGQLRAGLRRLVRAAWYGATPPPSHPTAARRSETASPLVRASTRTAMGLVKPRVRTSYTAARPGTHLREPRRRPAEWQAAASRVRTVHLFLEPGTSDSAPSP